MTYKVYSLSFWIPCFVYLLQSFYKWQIQLPWGGKGLIMSRSIRRMNRVVTIRTINSAYQYLSWYKMKLLESICEETETNTNNRMDIHVVIEVMISIEISMMFWISKIYERTERHLIISINWEYDTNHSFSFLIVLRYSHSTPIIYPMFHWLLVQNTF